jgi:hypothetical protein
MTAGDGVRATRTQPGQASDAGEWITLEVSYVDPTRHFCEFCGRPIARRFWQVRTEGGAGIFCDPGHAALYATYPTSRDGSDD